MLYDKVPDYSHWNGPLNLGVLLDRKIKRIKIKATDGDTFIDPEFFNNRAKAESLSLEWTAYHYFQPYKDPIKQANHFVSTVTKNGILPKHILLADVEEPPTGIYSPSADLLKFLLEIERLHGEKPEIYTRSSFWKLYYPGAYNWAGLYPLHAAHYKDELGPSVCMPWDPGNWSAWQYTDRERGPLYGTVSLQVDMSLAVPTPAIIVSGAKKVDVDYMLWLNAQPVEGAPLPTIKDWWTEFRIRRRKNFRKG